MNTKIDKTEFKCAAAFLADLIGAALNEETCEKVPQGCTWRQVYQLAKFSGVLGLSFFGAEDCAKQEDAPPGALHLADRELFEKWKDARDRTIYHQLYFDLEREQLLNALDKRKISYMVLKGVLLQHYYPKSGMRSMSDNDILYGYVKASEDGFAEVDAKTVGKEKSARQEVYELMTARGYELIEDNGGVDEYTKKPFYNFEMHRQLARKSNSLYSYYENPWKRAIQSEKNPYSFHMTDEDEYIYLLFHAWRHYESAGCGFRFLADIYVFLQKKGNCMDWGYVQRELEKLSLIQFESDMKALSKKCFEPGGVLSERDLEFICYLLSNGIYGTKDGKVAKRVQAEGHADSKKRKAVYVWRRIFPTKEECEDYYPFFANKRWLLPFYFVFRVVRGVFTKPKEIFDELKSLFKA